MQLIDRVAIVTGGASGIGEAIARRFAREGATVAILDIDKDKADRVAASITDGRAVAFACDVSREADVEPVVGQVAARLGMPNLLVNDAGIKPTLTPIDQLREADWDAMLDAHLRGCLLCTKHVIPHMKASGRGAIVNIASLAGIRGRPLRHSYIAAKHGIIGLTKSVALECVADNIRVNAIAPGPVATPMLIGGDRRRAGTSGSVGSKRTKPRADRRSIS